MIIKHFNIIVTNFLCDNSSLFVLKRTCISYPSIRAQTESSSSESSPLTPPRPLHPPSAFSDSRELSEAECDREMFQSEGGSGGGSRPRRRPSEGKSEGEDIKAELTVLLQRYKQQQEVQQQQLQQAKTSRGADKNPYTINV